MLIFIIVQLLFWYYFVDFFNKHAYHDNWWYQKSPKKVYINRFIQIIGYICNLVPGMLIIEIIIISGLLEDFIFPDVKVSIKETSWYKWLFNTPNDGKDD